MAAPRKPVWRGAVRVAGADFNAVTNRFERDGDVEDWALVTGLWSGDEIRVERQAPPPPRADPEVRWVTPPCPPPPGGWPEVARRGGILLDYDLGDLQETGKEVAVTLFRPSPNHAVLVVAASDIEAVEARMRAQLGGSLCVVASQWTEAQLDQVRGYLHAHHDMRNLCQWGPLNLGDGQAHGGPPGAGAARDRVLGRHASGTHLAAAAMAETIASLAITRPLRPPTSPRDPPARLSGQSRCFRMTRESCISTPNWLPRWVKSMPGRISDEEFYAVICDDAAAAEGTLGDQVVD